jgi:hypothetical protein
MLGINDKTNNIDKFSDLQAKVAVLENKIEHIDRQLESKSRLLQGIGIAVSAVLLLGVLKNAVDATNSVPKATPASTSNTTRSK